MHASGDAALRRACFGEAVADDLEEDASVAAEHATVWLSSTSARKDARREAPTSTLRGARRLARSGEAALRSQQGEVVAADKQMEACAMRTPAARRDVP